MNSRIYLIFTVFLAMIFAAVNAYGSTCSEGDKAYKILHYQKAINAYRLCEKNRSILDVKTLTQLAHCYRMLDKYAEAADVYKQTLKIKNAPQENYTLYLTCLQASGSTENYAKKLDSLIKVRPKDKKLAELKNSQNTYVTQDSFVVKKVEFNSDEADFAPQYLNGKFVFGSTRKSDAKIDGFTGQNFARLWTFDSITKMVSPYVIADVDAKYNIGTPVVDPLDGSIYFSANVPKVNRQGSANLAIYQHTNKGGKSDVQRWKNTLGNFNYTHPTISPDGRLMVFVSDQGGRAMDLYYCTRIKKNNDWSAPRPLKRNINTTGQEVFPRFVSNTTLVFSSDGLRIGDGLDLYKTAYINGQWSESTSIPFPINTFKDDYAIWTDSLMNDGFFTSNRDDKDGNEDIYSFKKIKKCVIKTQIFDGGKNVAVANQPIHYGSQAIATNDTKNYSAAFFSYYPGHDLKVSTIYSGIDFDTTIIANPACQGDTINILWRYKPSMITIIGRIIPKNGVLPRAIPIRLIEVNQIGSPIGTKDTVTVFTDEHGEFAVPLIEGKTYTFFTKADGFLPNNISSKISASKPEMNIELIPIDINSSFVLKDIYYDFDKWDIIPKSAMELDKLVKTLNEYPTLKIELSSHTDARGKDQYNMTLSSKRAKSAVDYIVSQGIPRSRLVAKGYGETRHVNKCVNGVECTEEEHQENRRTEVRILSK